MQTIEPPDIHWLNAASGWLDLGCPADARVELDRVHPDYRDHPAVLETHWKLCAAERDWTRALSVSLRLIEITPDTPIGWINHSYSLHELQRTDEALEKLLPAATLFPDVSTIPYNLACYQCRLGNMDEARAWLAKAIEVRGKSQIKTLALDDPDLEPLWAEIQAF